MKSIYTLSREELEILYEGRKNPSLITNYFFRPEGVEKGFIFDYNFTPEGKWQESFCLAKQTRIVVIGGFGTGKTQTVAMSACVWGMTTLDFKFMNIAPVSWQSTLMYQFIVGMAEDTPFQKLIYKNIERPYPKIVLKFVAGKVTVTSTFEFMSVDKNASKILSWDGDWINADEAGLIPSDDLEDTIKNAGSRLRGSTRRGRPRLGRLSLCSNSWDNPTLWYQFDLAESMPDERLSIIVSSKSNKNITPSQLKDMLRDIPEDERDQFIDGTRPMGKGNYFSANSVHECESKMMTAFLKEKISREVPGYVLQSTTGTGIYSYQIPRIEDHEYVMLADPGNGNAPSRNAPVIMVWDVHDFPKLQTTLAAFWWGRGNGSITPFLIQYFYLMSRYLPIFNGVDSTGTQKNVAEILNTYIFEKKQAEKKPKKEPGSSWLDQIDISGILNPKINGLDFSGGRKPMYLINARLMIEAELMVWPDIITGIRSQLTNYDPALDKASEPKFPQDIVATFAMSAHTIRSLFHLSTDDMADKNHEQNSNDDVDSGERDTRLQESERNLRLVASRSTDNDERGPGSDFSNY